MKNFCFKFQAQWYQEYKGGIRWHDYFSFMINQFPVVCFRKYDWPHDGDGYTFVVAILGFTVYHKTEEKK